MDFVEVNFYKMTIFVICSNNELILIIIKKTFQTYLIIIKNYYSSPNFQFCQMWNIEKSQNYYEQSKANFFKQEHLYFVCTITIIIHIIIYYINKQIHLQSWKKYFCISKMNIMFLCSSIVRRGTKFSKSITGS